MMAKVLASFVWSVFLVHVGSIVTLNKKNSCGDWKPYKDEKCFYIADSAGFQTKEDTEVVCEAFSQDSVSNLIRIKSKEEQEFLQRYLFAENNLLDNVWLGLSRKDSNGLFEWNDGSEMVFSNWASQTLPDEQHNCVQMESGDGALEAGRWLAVNCKRKNVVICERKPTWTLQTMQDILMNFKLEQETKQKEWEEKFENAEREQEMRENEWEKKFNKSELSIVELKQRNQVFAQEIATLTKNTVPVGLIYVQLAGQLSPFQLWPFTNWTDVSNRYAGLFFRVIGGKAAPFGQVQEANTSRLEQVNYHLQTSTGLITIPADGSWSSNVETGGSSTQNVHALSFRLSQAEIRPRNQAVKIWKRLQ